MGAKSPDEGEDISSIAGSTSHSEAPPARATRRDFTLDETMVKTYVKMNLFPRMKFITGENQLDFNDKDESSICYQCLDYNNLLHVEGREMFWAKHRKRIEREMKTRRNNVQSDMKEEFMGEFGLRQAL